MPFVFLELMNWPVLQFCTSQRQMGVQLASVAGGAIVHSIMIGVFYFWLDWGYTGVIWATACVFIARFLIAQTWIRVFSSSFHWFDDVQLFSRETVSNLKPMVVLCIGSMFMGIWGWWAFDIFTFMAQYLGETQAATQSIMRSIGLLTFMLPVGYSSASGILSGNAIGDSNPNQAL